MQHTKNKIGFENTMDGQDTLYASNEEQSNEHMPDYKNIKVHQDTHERLQSHGNMGETFDDLINRILDDWEEQEQENDE